MSYSLHERATTKEELQQKARASLEKSLEGQAAHQADKETVYAVVRGAINALTEEPGKTLVIVAYGHAGGKWEKGEYVGIDQVEITIKAAVVATPSA